jgi:hypothetical protein
VRTYLPWNNHPSKLAMASFTSSNSLLLTSIFISLSQINHDMPSSSPPDSKARPSTPPHQSLQQNLANPLTINSLDQSTLNLLLTLHAIFPNEFLPALDLLDRGLVTQFIPKDITPRAASSPATYFVFSAAMAHRQESATSPSARRTITSPKNRSSTGSKFHGSTSGSDTATTYYEVRTTAWNCTCPAFTFSAFPAFSKPTTHTDEVSVNVQPQRTVAATQQDWQWGGVSRNQEVAPVCKHLLACILCERAHGIFGKYLKERNVSKEEMATWSAGMGTGFAHHDEE